MTEKEKHKHKLLLDALLTEKEKQLISKEKHKYKLLLDALLTEKEKQLISAEQRQAYYTREIEYLRSCIETIKETYKI